MFIEKYSTDNLDLWNIEEGSKAEFRALREELGVTQDDLADALDVSIRTIKRWESPNFQNPPADAWEQLAEFAEDHAEKVFKLVGLLNAFVNFSRLSVLTIPYYRIPEGDCPPAMSFGMSNTQLREIANKVNCEVEFVYDDEAERDFNYWYVKLVLDMVKYGDDTPCIVYFSEEGGEKTIEAYELDWLEIDGSDEGQRLSEMFDSYEENTLFEAFGAFLASSMKRNWTDDKIQEFLELVNETVDPEEDEGSSATKRARKREQESPFYWEKNRSHEDNVARQEHIREWFTEIYEMVEYSSSSWSPLENSIENDLELARLLFEPGKLREYECLFSTEEVSSLSSDEIEACLQGVSPSVFNPQDDEALYEQLEGIGEDPAGWLYLFDDENVAKYGPGYDPDDIEE